MVEIVVREQPILIAFQRLVHAFLNFLLLKGGIPDTQLVHFAVEILYRGIVGEPDVDVFLPIKIRRVLLAFDDQFTVHVHVLAPEIHADDVRDVMPFAVCQLQAFRHFDARPAPRANADVAVNQMDMPIMATGPEVLVYNTKQSGVRVFRAKPKFHRILRLGNVDRHRDVLLQFAVKLQRAAAAVRAKPTVCIRFSGDFRFEAGGAFLRGGYIAWLGDDFCRLRERR